MSESVACPGCRATVAIPADHTEPSIRCGICWSEIAMAVRAAAVAPAPVTVPPPALAVAKRPAVALPGKALPSMAKLEERMQRAAARLAPASAPVKALPVPAAVVTKPSAPLVEIQPVPVTVAPAPIVIEPEPMVAEVVVETVDDEPMERPSRSSRSSSRRFQRDEDDDDFDDRPRRRPRRPERSSALPLVIGVGAFLVLLVGGVYILARSLRDPSDRDPVPVAEGGDPAAMFNLPNPDANPAGARAPAIGFNPFPNLPNMQPPGANLALAAHAGDGYSAKIFGRPTEYPSFLNLYDDAFLIANVRSKFLRSGSMPPSATIEITTADAPQGVTPDLKRIVTETVFRRGDVKEAKLAGHAGFEHIDDFAGRNTTTRTVKVGCRIFLAKFTIMDAFGNRQAAEAARKEFFDSFTITFDAATPAPVNPGLVPRRLPPRPPIPPRPKLPGRP